MASSEDAGVGIDLRKGATGCNVPKKQAAPGMRFCTAFWSLRLFLSERGELDP
jgi:hypothetical protein